MPRVRVDLTDEELEALDHEVDQEAHGQGDHWQPSAASRTERRRALRRAHRVGGPGVADLLHESVPKTAGR